ncbi:LPXTG cell wall anchor domain-containing protein [Paenibacillus sp. GXUN7292]|uniref:LPXTG cell wall anchor domain-containing protein n=1 Tax=Paenibacillus sp. GXUN7292 TaxID=3422499 RepID=UPI003D7C5FF6
MEYEEHEEETSGSGNNNGGTGGEIVNEEEVPLEKLPKTGDTSALPYYFIGSFVTLAGIVTLFARRKSL